MKSFTEQYKSHLRTENFFVAFLETLDDKLSGNKVYDWYYYNIWSRIWRLFKVYPKTFKFTILRYIQRGKTGISTEDCWSVADWFYETLAEACKKFIKGEYGDSEPDWKSWNCLTHDKALYKKLTNYIKLYELYESHLKDESIKYIDLEKDIKEIHKQAVSIVKDDIEKMWN